MSRDTVTIQSEDLARAMPFGFLVDDSGHFSSVGNALQRCLGIVAGSLVDDHFSIVRPVGRQRFADLEPNPGHTIHLRSRTSALELKGSALPLDGGRRAYFGSPIVHDIDEFKQLGLRINDFPPADATPDLLLSMQATRTALRDARKLATDLKVALADSRAATEAKARFLAVMSHEIRTPLNGFGSMIDLLRDGDLTEDQRDQLETMDRCAHSLLVLVNDILDFSKLEAGRVVIDPEPTDIAAALQQIAEHFESIARARGLTLRLETDGLSHSWASIDFERMRQVLANLVGNAIKFTPAGSIRIVARTDGPLLSLDVIDTGIGIPPHHHVHLFEPFVQADASTTRRFGGTGLGLTISRQLARAMSGDVELIHTDTAGTHFRFSLEAPPCAGPRAADTVSTVAERCTFPGVRILVAEDDPTNQVIAQRMLQKLGAEAVVVCDGEQAVEAASRDHYDLVLMDLMMPNVDGIEATRRIRASHGPCCEVPVVAFSAAAMDADRAAASRAGMSGFLEKPARLASLRTVLQRYLGEVAG